MEPRGRRKCFSGFTRPTSHPTSISASSFSPSIIFSPKSTSLASTPPPPPCPLSPALKPSFSLSTPPRPNHVQANQSSSRFLISLYHTFRNKPNPNLNAQSRPSNGFSNKIMVSEIDDVVQEMSNLGIIKNRTVSAPKGTQIPLPWELLQPMLRIMGHCLLVSLNAGEIKDVASVAVRCFYARASHDLAPQAILATQSLIQLDKRARESARATTMATAASNANTPSNAKKPKMLLASK